MSIPWSKEQLMRANTKLLEKNKRYKQALEEVESSLLRANKGYVNNRDYYVNYNIHEALETIQALKEAGSQ